jgi:hypothetical protein
MHMCEWFALELIARGERLQTTSHSELASYLEKYPQPLPYDPRKPRYK